MVAAFVIKREAVTERVFCQNGLLPLPTTDRLSSFLRPHRPIFWANHALLSCYVAEMPRPPGLASLFVQSRAYQTSVTLPVLVLVLPLWTRIVSALAVWMSTLCS